MSFAQGFAAGSTAVQRGLAMRDLREQREREEAYRQAVADYNAGIAQQEDALAAYEAQEQSALGAGMGLQSPVQPTGVEAQLLSSMPGAPAQGAQMSPVAQPQAFQTGLGGGSRQAISMGPRPEPLSYIDRQRGLADIAMQYGDTRTALSLMSQAQAEERALRTEAAAAERYAQDFGLRERTLDETIRGNQVSERLAQETADSLADYRRQSGERIEALTAQINALNQSASLDANRARHVNIGRDATIGFRQGLSLDEVYRGLEDQYRDPETGELDNANFAIAANSAASEYFGKYLNMNEAQVGAVGAKALEPLDRALLATQNTPDMSDDMFIRTYDDAIKNFADPDFSDGIETQLVAVKDEDGNPTGAYELRYGGEVLPNGRFANRDEVNAFAAQQKEEYLSSPFSVIRYMENQKTALGVKLARLERVEEKEDAFFEYLEANPQARDREMELRRMYGLPSGLSTGGRFGGDGGSGSTSTTSPGLARLQRRREAEDKAEAEGNTARDTARQIVALAKTPDELAEARALESPEVQALIDEFSSFNKSLADARATSQRLQEEFYGAID